MVSVVKDVVAIVCQRDASTTYACDAAIKCAHVYAHEHVSCELARQHLQT